MSVDKLVDSTQLDSDLTSVANAIRAKSGGSSQLAFPAGFVSEIQAIPSGGGDDPNICTIKGVFAVSLYHDTGMPTKYKIETPLLDSFLTGMNATGRSPTQNSGLEEIEVVANSQTVGINLTANMNVNTTYALKKVNFNFVPLANCYQMFLVTYANRAPYFEDCLGLNFALVGGGNYRTGGGFVNCGALKNVTCKPNTLGQLDLIAQTKNWFQINASPLLTDASLCQIANALCATHTSKVQLHSTPKARCSTLMGTVSQVTDDTGTYDFFTADASGTVSLADFITNVKGWTLA